MLNNFLIESTIMKIDAIALKIVHTRKMYSIISYPNASLYE
nr:MAG TPA: hypothetical protein [Caudoviricetes sp.]